MDKSSFPCITYLGFKSRSAFSTQMAPQWLQAEQSAAPLDVGVLGGEADREEPGAARLMVEAEGLSGAPSAGLGSKGKEPSKLL